MDLVWRDSTAICWPFDPSAKRKINVFLYSSILTQAKQRTTSFVKPSIFRFVDQTPSQFITVKPHLEGKNKVLSPHWNSSRKKLPTIEQWIGLRENLNRKPYIFPLTTGFSLPIQWINQGHSIAWLGSAVHSSASVAKRWSAMALMARLVIRKIGRLVWHGGNS